MDIVPMQIRVIKHIRKVYGYRPAQQVRRCVFGNPQAWGRGTLFRLWRRVAL
ncbi:hypothetical protein [Pseudomonas syringae]|uniref:hypothetical protein n=1 Tax=Pseudomonas syringae TaxID=317 RepID=UPI00352A2964